MVNSTEKTGFVAEGDRTKAETESMSVMTSRQDEARCWGGWGYGQCTTKHGQGKELSVYLNSN